MITCKPWNPVAIKNVEPKEESAIQKGASMYSKPWKKVNTIPNKMVNFKAIFALLKFFFNISWWDHVIDTPDESSKIVFNKGTLIGLKEWIELGGQDWPSSTVGEILLWKKAQKKETKNKISDAINKTIPVFKPFITRFEWFPWDVPSRWTSRHQEKATKSIIINDKPKNFIETLFIITKPDKTKQKAPFEAKIGQGLMSTRWKGLNLFIII